MIIDAYKSISLSGRTVLYDTNIWIILEGFDPNMRTTKATAYQRAHRELVIGKNTVVVTDLVIMEFFNRCCKINYEFKKGANPHSPTYATYKTYRISSEYAEDVSAVVDSCLRIIDENEYVPVDFGKETIASAIECVSRGSMDMTDFYLASSCLAHKYVVMSDDCDLYDGSIEMITANKRLLASA